VGYCTILDLDGGINPGALKSLFPDDKQRAIDWAAATMDSYFRSRFDAPLTTHGADVTRVNVKMAVYYLMTQRGYSSDTGSDQIIRLEYEDCLAWLKSVSRGEVTPIATVQPAAPSGGQPYITSQTKRFSY